MWQVNRRYLLLIQGYITYEQFKATNVYVDVLAKMMQSKIPRPTPLQIKNRKLAQMQSNIDRLKKDLRMPIQEPPQEPPKFGLNQPDQIKFESSLKHN